jgi:hypothetical protein
VPPAAHTGKGRPRKNLCRDSETPPVSIKALAQSLPPEA